MSYLNPPYLDNFQELCAAMPLFYLEVLEMRAILRAQGRLLDGLCDGMGKLVDVNFILTADEATIRMWEKALKITNTNALSLDMRKHIIIGYIIGLGHIGEPEIREIIALYTDFAAELEFERGDISITLDGIGLVPAYENLIETLCKRLPAHLSLRFIVNIRSLRPASIHVGGVVGAQPSIGVPLGPDEYDFRGDLHLGGGVGAQPSIGVPVEPDTYQSESRVQAGGVVEIQPVIRLPPGKDTYDFQDTIRAGGRFSGRESFPVPEDTTQPPATTILRSGGVFTFISNLSGED